MEENIALEDGFSSYFAFSRKRSGYSGKRVGAKQSTKLKEIVFKFVKTQKPHWLILNLGVATFCRDSFTPTKAEEGLGGTLASSDFEDSIGYYGHINQEFTWSERRELDSEGRAVLTQHEVQVREIEQKYFRALKKADFEAHQYFLT